MIVIVACVLAAFFGSTASLSRQTDPSKAHLYVFESALRLGENDGGEGHGHDTAPETETTEKNNDLAYRLVGEVIVSLIWLNPDNRLHSLLHMRILSLSVLVKNKKKNKLGFDEQKTNVLESTRNEAFLVEQIQGRVEKIYLQPDEEIFTKNLKKAIASLFQFQSTHSHVEEIDVCGLCKATYEVIDARTILKLKKDCRSHLPANQHSEPIFGAIVDAERKVVYEMGEDLNSLVKVASYEKLDLKLSIKKEISLTIVATIDLSLKETPVSEISKLPRATLADDAVSEIMKTLSLNLQPDALYLSEEPLPGDTKSLPKILKEVRQYLTASQLGTYKSAVAFLQILKVVRESSENEIVKVLKNKKNEPILTQFMDVLGCAQSLVAHNAVMKTFDFVRPKDIEPLERYLWSISVGRQPKIQFVQDLISMFKKNPTDEKLKETILLTIAALSTKFSEDVVEEVYSLIIDSTSKCPVDDDKCVAMYFRAFGNLKYPKAKSILLHHAITGSRVLSVTALKVLYSLPSSVWDEDVLKVAERIYYQKDRIYDSSARTIAIDIIVDSNPEPETLRHLLRSLKTNTSFEARKYLLQRLQQTASTNDSFATTLKELMKEENLLHYGILAQKGLSNALTRRIFEERDFNASIFTINEVSKSVLKRGHVSVALSQNNDTAEIASLDLHTGGLSSFLWSSEDTAGEEELEEAEDLMAGMELTIRGVQLRPFVFFNGHAELMGHIWAGTASDRTSALQTIGLLQEHNEFIALNTGNVVKFDLIGSYSAELAGQITFSIWNRNAHSVVQSSVGAAVHGSAAINTFFAKNTVNFKIYSENEVEMIADLDFYDEVLFCLQISQMKTIAKYEVEKEQSIPNSSHRVRRRKQRELVLPGRTFQLNQKNNDMCNSILGRAS